MDNTSIPYIAFESATARQERTIKRLWIICIILIISLLGTNAGWIWYENQWEDVVTVEQGAEWDKGNVILNGTGEVNVNGQGISEGN